MTSQFMQESLGWFETIKMEALKQVIEKLGAALVEQGGGEALTELLNKIDIKTFLLAEVGVFFFIILVRSYVFSKVKGFWSHFFSELWTFAIYLSLSLFFVPLFLFGFEFFDVIKLIVKAVQAL